VRTAVPGIDLQGPRVMLEGQFELSALAVRVAEVVLDFRVARVAQRCRGQAREGNTPVPRVNGMPAGRIVRVEARSRRIVRPGIGGRRGRPRRDTRRHQDDPEYPGVRATHHLHARIRCAGSGQDDGAVTRLAIPARKDRRCMTPPPSDTWDTATVRRQTRSVKQRSGELTCLPKISDVLRRANKSAARRVAPTPFDETNSWVKS